MNKYEVKIMGYHILWITMTVIMVFVLMFASGGDLINWSYLGFEVFFPIYTAIMVAEYVKIKNDIMYEVLLVHSRSIFTWILRRFMYIYLLVGVLVICTMTVLKLFIFDIHILNLIFIYGGTSFFFATLAVLSSIFYKYDHSATCICGLIWIFFLLIRSLVRLPGIAIIYPFIKFVDSSSGIWIQNKMNLILISILFWIIIYFWSLFRGKKWSGIILRIR